MAEISKLTEGRGANVILDMVGGSYIERNLRCLALEGRLVQIAFLQPSRVEVDWMPLMLKRLTFTGSTLRPRRVRRRRGWRANCASTSGRCSSRRRWRRSIYREFPLADAAGATG